MRHWVVEVPRQERVRIWEGTCDDIVDQAQRRANGRGSGGWWQGWYSLEQAVDEYGEVPEGWSSVLERTNEVTEIGGQLYAKGEEPQTEFEWAIATLGADLHAIYVLDDIKEMAAWAQSYSGHQSLVVQALVTRLIGEAASSGMKQCVGSTPETAVGDLDKPCDRGMRESGTVCAAYVRTNRINSEGAMSLASQEESLRIVAADNGVEALEMFRDIGVKADSKKKPALQELLELGRTGTLRQLLVVDWTRFSRDRKEAVAVIAQFRKLGVQIAFVRGDESTFYSG